MAELSRSANAGTTAAQLLLAVGQRVRQLRQQHGLSRRVLSENSGVSPRYLAQLESGEGNISIVLLARVADALACDVPALLRNPAVIDQPVSSSSSDTAQLHRINTLLPTADAALRTRILELLEQGGTQRRQRVSLIGLRGAGKSTLGRMAGESLDIPFVELNEQIEQQAGMPVAEVIGLYGAEGYRDLESAALSRVASEHSRVVLAVAGGIVSNPQTYQHLLDDFHTVWLRASPAEHMQRVLAQGDTRPMAGNPAAMEQLKKLLSDREADYGRAMYCVDTEGRDAKQTLVSLLSILRGIATAAL